MSGTTITRCDTAIVTDIDTAIGIVGGVSDMHGRGPTGVSMCASDADGAQTGVLTAPREA